MLGGLKAGVGWRNSTKSMERAGGRFYLQTVKKWNLSHFAGENIETMVKVIVNFKSSCLQIFFKIGALKDFANFTRKKSVLEFLFNSRPSGV